MSARGKTIFILGAARFDSPVASTSFTLAKHLAQNNRVYYIDYPFTWRDQIALRHTKEFKTREKYFRRSSKPYFTTENPNLKVLIVPPVASINFLPEGRLYRFLLSLVERTIRNRIRQVLRAEGISDFIYINSFNFHYPNISRGLFPKLTVYHCVDPVIVEYDLRHGKISEEILVRDSDLVICTSKQLYDEKAGANSRCYFVPNAADIHHSRKALDEAVPVHPALHAVRKPIIGYFGNIERRMDFDLLRSVIDLNRDKTFVFAGPVSEDTVPEWFLSDPLVYLTGSISYEEMPSMVKGFDVAIIPFKKDGVSATIFPLKLFEYLGAGKPVVATDFNPDLKEFTGETVYYCSTAEAFSAAITEALNNNSKQCISQRLQVAEANTWVRRAAEFEEILRENYPV
ncbi:MAG TPA: glycosyltransferase [Sphingobacteriaceae bacterium]